MTTITREWLQQTIAEFENTRDDIPFGLSDDDAKILIVLKRALVSLDAEPVRYLNKFSGTCVTLEQQPNAADDVAVYIPLHAAQPVQETGVYKDMLNIIGLLENNEWAEHCTSTVLGSLLESEITRLVGKEQLMSVVPETLPCPVHLVPGLRLGKGCKTETLLIALQRRAEYYAGLDAMTPEERAEHDASIEAFKAMLPQPAPVDKEFIPKNLDKALGVVGVALPESKEEFNFQIERWIQRLIDRVIRYADEFKEQPVPVVPDDISGIIERFQYQADHLSEWHHIDEHSCKVNRRDLMTALEFMDSCRAAMLNGGKS
ncbi:DUF550 domain-containing protein [Salmonella enterica subsp. enterica serovar Salford]